jgi:hypothetical protein
MEDARWRIEEEPVLHIGSADGDPVYQFGRVAVATRLGNGTVLVVDEMTQAMSLFDSAGQYIRRIGGRGKGPGEYTALYRIVRLPADSFLAWDLEQNRGTVYSADGGRVRNLPSSTRGTRYSDPDVMTALPDGRFIAATSAGPPIETPGFTPRHGGYWRALAILDHNGALVDTIGEYSIAPCPGTAQECSRSLFAPQGYYAVTPARVYYGFNDAMDIAVFDLDGRMNTRIRRDVEPVTITDAVRDSVYEAMIERTDPRDRQRLRRSLETLPRDSVMPRFGPLRADAVGNLWVVNITEPYQMRPYAFADIKVRFGPSRPSFAVFDTAGVYLGDVETPRGLEIREIGDDYVLGVWRDDMDVEYVRMHRLIKPE